MNLARHWFAASTEWHPDPRLHAHNSGLRAAWLHIQQMLNLSPQQIAHLAQGQGLGLDPFGVGDDR